MPSRTKPVGVHIATAGLPPRQPASATPVISDKVSFLCMYFLRRLMAETIDRSGPVPKHRIGEDVPPRLVGKIAAQIPRFSTLGSAECNVLTGAREHNLRKRKDGGESQFDER